MALCKAAETQHAVTAPKRQLGVLRPRDLGGKPEILRARVRQTLHGLLQRFGRLDQLLQGCPGELPPARLLRAGDRGPHSGERLRASCSRAPRAGTDCSLSCYF